MLLDSFNFNGIGSVRAFNKDGEPWFVAKDVAELLAYTNTRKAINDHCKAAVSVGSNESLPLDPQTKIIPERDVYRLIMRSKLPAAEAFEEWVVGTVLPAIRKTGGYVAGEEHIESEEELTLRVMKMLERKIEAMKPKADYHDKWHNAEGSYNTTELAKKLGTTAVKLNKFLKEKGVKFKDKDLPKAGYEDWFQMIELVVGDKKLAGQCKITPKGCVKITELFNKAA